MDPLTHTLFGAALADAGLRRRTRLATATLVIGANLPDVDVLAYAEGADAALGFRRGWTHGVLAMAVLPLVLAGLMTAWSRWRGAGARPRELLLLSCLAVWSHPLLDWLNNYGVRFLMPFDGTWFYGDAVFIMDPWLWLMLGGMLFLNHSSTWRSRSNWAALAVLTSVPVLGAALAGVDRPGAEPRTWAAPVWVAGLALLIACKFFSTTDPQRRARRTLAAVAFYVLVVMLGGTLAVEQRLANALAGESVEAFMVSPVPLDPLERLVLVARAGEYQYATHHWLAAEPLRFFSESQDDATIVRRPPSDAARAARAAPCVRGLVGWMRFPFYVETAQGDDTEVFLLDARYVRRPTTEFGGARVVVDSELRPRCP